MQNVAKTYARLMRDDAIALRNGGFIVHSDNADENFGEILTKRTKISNAYQILGSIKHLSKLIQEGGKRVSVDHAN